MMQSLKSILVGRPAISGDKYLTRDFQALGLHLAASLGDIKRKALYIKLAKSTDRPTLEKALSFVADANARNKGALFMWKLKQLKNARKTVK